MSLKVIGYIQPVRVCEVRLGFFIIICLLQLIMKGENYRLQDLEKIYIELAKKKENPDPATFKQQINAISRILIWDDQQHGDIFAFVFEAKMLQNLLDIFSHARDKQLVNTILGFFTILLTNLTKLPSVNGLLSHPVVACLTLAKFNNMNHQVVDFYINFLKVLSRKISSQNLNVFFNKRYAAFPLLWQSIRFFNHPENIVRTTCSNIVLSFAKLPNKLLHSFMVGFPFCTYFVHQCSFIKQYWFIADRIVRSVGDNTYQLAHLDSLLQDHEEVLIFIEDLLSIKVPAMPQIFISAFVNQCLNPLMLSLDLEAKDGISIQLCIYILTALFKSFRDSFMMDALALVVFGKYHTKELADCIYEPIPCLLSYDKKWKFKGFWDSHEDKISKYCIQAFHSEGTKNEQSSINQNLGTNMDTSAIFGVTNNFYERQIEKVEDIFGIPIITKKQNLKRKGAAANIQAMLTSISDSSLNIENCQINNVSQTILSYLNSKDDSLVMLTANLLAAYFQNSHISPQVSLFCRLSLKPQNRDFQSVIKIEKIIISCIKTFSVDPPCYRICTYIQVRDLCKQLSDFYSPKDFPLSTDIIASLKNGLKISINRINPYLYSGKQWEISLMTYMQLLKKGKKRRKKTLKVFGLVTSQEEEKDSLPISAIDYVYENGPKQFKHQITRDFWIYFIVKELFLEFNSVHSFTNIELKNTNSESCKYEKGKSYEKIDDQMIAAEYHRNAKDKYTDCGLILLTGYLVLIDKNVVQYRQSYHQFLAISDRSDPRKLFLKGEEVTIWLQMKQASTAQALLRHMEEGRSTLLRYKLTEIIKEVELLMKSCVQ